MISLLPPGTVTTSEAAAIAGVSWTTVNSHYKRGKLPGVVLDNWKGNPAGACAPRFCFYVNDVKEWATTLSRQAGAGTTREYWTEADDEALRELRGTCTLEQAAVYLGRTLSAVNARSFRLGGGDGGPGMWMVPFNMPPGAILLARTCCGCGKIRDAHYFGSAEKQKRNPRGTCRVCRRAENVGRKRGQCPSDLKYEALQQVTKAQAFNERRRYTDDERDLLRDTEISTFDLCFKLNRSWKAVSHQREKMGIAPKRRQWMDLTDSHWAIVFPAATEALAAHYRNLNTSTEEFTMEGEM